MAKCNYVVDNSPLIRYGTRKTPVNVMNANSSGKCLFAHYGFRIWHEAHYSGYPRMNCWWLLPGRIRLWSVLTRLLARCSESEKITSVPFLYAVCWIIMNCFAVICHTASALLQFLCIEIDHSTFSSHKNENDRCCWDRLSAFITSLASRLWCKWLCGRTVAT